jgi:protein-S-isoprenylcysteine O-methyltransferase Ste14
MTLVLILNLFFQSSSQPVYLFLVLWVHALVAAKVPREFSPPRVKNHFWLALNSRPGLHRICVDSVQIGFRVGICFIAMILVSRVMHFLTLMSVFVILVYALLHSLKLDNEESDLSEGSGG